MNRVNLFSPFERPPDQAEDRLTWAFLVALKYDPYLQNFLREMVESQLPSEYREYSNIWEPAHISTQVAKIDSDPTHPIDRLVSILLTDARIQEVVKVKWSCREARYDGVIKYPNGLTLFVENKPSHGKVWKEQLSPSRDSFSGDIDDVTLHDSAVCLEWSEILEGMLGYAYSNIATFGSREIALDFLSFVEKHHPKLTPYRTFKLCGDRPEALNRRIILLLNKLAELANKRKLESEKKLEVKEKKYPYLHRQDKIAERVGMEVKEKNLRINLAPADTVAQAQKFFAKVDKEAFLSLEESSAWTVRPNLHFSFMHVTNLIRAETTWETRKYFDHFSDGHGSLFGKKSWDKLSTLVEQWVGDGLIQSEDREKFVEIELNKNYPYLNVVPGFLVSREWDLDTVIQWEKSEELETQIGNELAIPLKTWGEEL